MSITGRLIGRDLATFSNILSASGPYFVREFKKVTGTQSDRVLTSRRHLVIALKSRSGSAHEPESPALADVTDESFQRSLSHHSLAPAQANVYSLPFADATYDVVTGWGLLLYLSDPQKAIREMLRVLKPGGVIAFLSADWGGCLYSPETPGVVAALEYFKKMMVSISKPFSAPRQCSPSFLLCWQSLYKSSVVL